MKLPYAQLNAMIRYEARMLWRRRGIAVLLTAFFAVLVLAALGLRAMGQGIEGELEAAAVTVTAADADRVARSQATLSMIMGTWPVALFICILALPVMIAETIPADRQVGVRNLLDSLPVSLSTYLIGKLLGVWSSLLVGLCALAVLFGFVGWEIHGAFHPEVYLALWCLGIIPLALYTSGISLLLPAGQPNRWRAIFVNLFFAGFCVTMLATTSGTQWDIISLARPSIFLILQFEDLGLNPYPQSQISLTLAIAGLQFLLVWLVVRLWLSWREGR